MGRLPQHKTQQVHNILNTATYPIIQQTDATLNINRTEPHTQSTKNGDYAELINQVEFSLPAMDGFIPNSPKNYNYFYDQDVILNDALLCEAQP